MSEKTLNNKSIKDVKKRVRDVEVFGDGDTFILISKAGSKKEGWMKSTRFMNTGNGGVVQVTTQQKNKDGSYSIAEAVTFVPEVAIRFDEFTSNPMISHLAYVDATTPYKEPFRSFMRRVLPFKHLVTCEVRNEKGAPFMEIATWRMFLGRIFNYKVVEMSMEEFGTLDK